MNFNSNLMVETDRTPDVIHVSLWSIGSNVVGMAWHLIALGMNINVAARYCSADKMTEFWWTLSFLVIPAFISTAVSLRMYAQDEKKVAPLSNKFTRQKWVRTVFLGLQQALLLRVVDVVMYGVKTRRAVSNHEDTEGLTYFELMLQANSRAAMLRVLKCFLQNAPQLVLQSYLVLRTGNEFTLHQALAIGGSLVSMGWCMGSYNRALRYVRDKDNMTNIHTGLQAAYHLLILLSRIVSLTVLTCLFPHGAVLACLVHIMLMATLIQLYDRSFCAWNKMADSAFSVALGAVYIFVYIPVERITRYRYIGYYSLCLLENVICGGLWYFCIDNEERRTEYFLPLFFLTWLPYLLGISLMAVYYTYWHPKNESITKYFVKLENFFSC